MSIGPRITIGLVREGGGDREERSGVDILPSVGTEVMPVLNFDLKGLRTCIEIWSMPASVQVASACKFFQLGKFLIGGFSSLEISLLFPLSTALETHTFVDEL
ncbi:hypothetical protein Nepgr_016241 [Nepenthes gracilis]|uniref:Uncharacterized protein n=1 Tax=Nepenthes gracilis TaxID=150966 RepID=A0AAD3XSB9_NEPGR|nr:hypothetical protein Nepgr_016241 [Nepenthes gracilis]